MYFLLLFSSSSNPIQLFDGFDWQDWTKEREEHFKAKSLSKKLLKKNQKHFHFEKYLLLLREKMESL